MTIPDVVTVGEAMALLIARTTGPLETVGEFERATAGAELNVAVGLSRLGFHVGYIGGLGQDSLGRHLRAFMSDERLDLRHLWMDERYPTGLMLKRLAEGDADPEVEYFRRGSAASHLSARDLPAPDSDFGRARLLHLTGICPALSRSCRELAFALAHQARAAGRTVTFDPNLRPRLWQSQTAMVEVVNALACEADIVMPGLAEGRVLTGSDDPAAIACYYLDRGVRQVIVKLGPAGAYLAGAGVEPDIVPGVQVPKVVDTVGAGDGFAVGVISALLDGLRLREAAERGCAIGARVVQFRGDCEGLPDRSQLAAMTAPLETTRTDMEIQA